MTDNNILTTIVLYAETGKFGITNGWEIPGLSPKPTTFLDKRTED